MVVTGCHTGVALSAKVMNKKHISGFKIVWSSLPALGSPLEQFIVVGCFVLIDIFNLSRGRKQLKQCKGKVHFANFYYHFNKDSKEACPWLCSIVLNCPSPPLLIVAHLMVVHPSRMLFHVLNIHYVFCQVVIVLNRVARVGDSWPCREQPYYQWSKIALTGREFG